MKESKKKKISLLALLLLLCLVMAPVQASAAKVSLNKTAASVKIGKTITLKVSGTSSKVTWKSSNKSIAKVSSNGVVTGVSLGTAKIRATVNGKTYSCKVTVKNANATAKSLKFTTSGGEYFIIGESKAKISFKLSATSANVVVYIKNSSDETVYKKSYKKCTKGKTYSFTWNGADTDGGMVSAGTYRVQVRAYETRTTSDCLILYSQQFSGGTGTSSDPFRIASLEQLQNIPRFNGCYFRQTKDIDAGNGTITGMFPKDTKFTGTYDGGGYTISNLCISINTGFTGTTVNGLFAYIAKSGAVKNLNFSNVNAPDAKAKVAGVLCGYNEGKISNCTFTRCNVSSQGRKDIYLGIVCGYNLADGTITQCTTSDCSVSKGDGYNGRAGSIAGINAGSIYDCTSTNVSVSAIDYYSYSGGLVGSNKGNLINCTATGEVSGYQPAGICGYNSGLIKRCYFTGIAKSLTVHHDEGTIS
ncbi:MAG: Ig-like domain-containing protein [Lachnospiraceae bacterium]|nr:Ig-like domain-containing protein [Lachnospiraceae bacterium]